MAALTVTMEMVRPSYQFHPRAWLYFLSRFLKPCNLAHYEGDGQAYWDALFGHSRESMVCDLLTRGMLADCSLDEKLSETLTIVDLKMLADQHAIKLPKKKAAMIRGLIDALPMEMERLAAPLRYVKCTAAGAEEVMGYFRVEQALYQGAADQVDAHVRGGNLTGAIDAAAAYWDSQIFRRGAFNRDEAFARDVLGGILGGQYLDQDKRAACLVYLLSGSYPGQWAMEKPR